MADDLTGGESAADSTYRWTIRTLYAVAIALNVWVLWDSVADDTDAQILRAKVEALGAKLLRPFHLDREVRRQTGAVLWEAEQIVEDA